METTSDLYSIPLEQIDGTPTTLGQFAGDVVLVVNVASECGLTPQYGGLQQLYERYRDRGFVVLGFPCNQFGAQEPGSNEQIARFCSLEFRVTFPMFAKIDVNGEGRHPLYRAMIGEGGDIAWNFEKFLIDRSGHVVERFDPETTPEDDRLRACIESTIA
ncbi:MAG: glutathione peroxidase [Candidatus Eremiobacteraeota bacterium]|nr:glutathione peroxidase [Candidatus Eremiobacteraeota bacterium]